MVFRLESFLETFESIDALRTNIEIEGGMITSWIELSISLHQVCEVLTQNSNVQIGLIEVCERWVKLANRRNPILLQLPFNAGPLVQAARCEVVKCNVISA